MSKQSKEWDIANGLSRTIIDALEEQDIVDCQLRVATVRIDSDISTISGTLDGVKFTLQFNIGEVCE